MCDAKPDVSVNSLWVLIERLEFLPLNKLKQNSNTKFRLKKYLSKGFPSFNELQLQHSFAISTWLVIGWRMEIADSFRILPKSRIQIGKVADFAIFNNVVFLNLLFQQLFLFQSLSSKFYLKKGLGAIFILRKGVLRLFWTTHPPT